jgi:hypothetical protein
VGVALLPERVEEGGDEVEVVEAGGLVRFG